MSSEKQVSKALVIGALLRFIPIAVTLFSLGLIEPTSVFAQAQKFPKLQHLTIGPKNDIKLYMESEKRCNFSDLDAITSEINQTYAFAMEVTNVHPGTQVYMSIEPLLPIDNKTVFKPTAQCLSCQTFDPAKGAKVSLPESDKPLLAGIFVCTASAAKDEEKVWCNTKEVASWQKVFEPYEVEVDPATGMGKLKNISAQPTDKIFFFQPIIIDKGVLHFATNAMTQQDYLELLSLTSKKMREKSESMLRTYAQLGSSPLKSKPDGVSINLPHYSAAKCGH